MSHPSQCNDSCSRERVDVVTVHVTRFEDGLNLYCVSDCYDSATVIGPLTQNSPYDETAMLMPCSTRQLLIYKT